jgi:hypothetical protein
MPLTTDWREVKDEHALEFLRTPRADYNTGVISMAIGVPRITEKTYVEWYKRHLQFQLATGATIAEINSWYPLSLVKGLIGYSCSVSEITPAAFRKKVAQLMDEFATKHVSLQQFEMEPAND